MENLKLENAALILEGGGLRGTFTGGALRRFVDDKLYFAYVIGVSMGACNAANYLSLQPERNRIVNTRFLRDSRYISYRRLFLGGDLFGMNFIFDDIPNRLVPFDSKTLLENPAHYIMGVTDCMTGEPLYFKKNDLGLKFMHVLRASSSLPVAAKPVEFEGKILMDGGMSDPIPIRRAAEDGYKKRVVILTRQRGYRKKPSRMPNIFHYQYKKFPGLMKRIKTQYLHYNETIEYVESLEAQGEIFVIRPEEKPPAGRVERDVTKVYLNYDLGYATASARFPELLEYLQR